MRFKAYAATVTGPRHQRLHQENQDAVLVRIWRDQWLAVVSDGVGSRLHADIGSQMACASVCHIVRGSKFNEPDRSLILSIYRNWLDRLGHIEPDDAAATCLFAWGLRTGETRLFQLGDGAIFYHTNRFGSIKNSDEMKFSNETTGLGISRKMSDWMCDRVTLTDPTHAVALMTDGISDDLVNEEQLLPILHTSLNKKSPRLGKKWLKKQLYDWDTPHHTDDKTIALVYRI